jgi:hypothetical protein
MLLSIPRPRLWLPAWFANHLKHGADGHLLRRGTSGHLINTCAAACLCPPTGVSTAYTVSGFGGLSPCGTCDPGTDPPWNGTLNRVNTTCVWWAADPGFDPLTINGVELDITYTQIALNTSPCRWELYIACYSATHPTAIMWWGTKTYAGGNPAGTYAIAGSDCGNTTTSMTVT